MNLILFLRFEIEEQTNFKLQTIKAKEFYKKTIFSFSFDKELMKGSLFYAKFLVHFSFILAEKCGKK